MGAHVVFELGRLFTNNASEEHHLGGNVRGLLGGGGIVNLGDDEGGTCLAVCSEAGGEGLAVVLFALCVGDGRRVAMEPGGHLELAHFAVSIGDVVLDRERSEFSRVEEIDCLWVNVWGREERGNPRMRRESSEVGRFYGLVV